MLQKGGEPDYQDPKTAKGRRLVNLTPSTVTMLRNLLKRQPGDALLFGYHIDEESLLFRYRGGSPILPRGLTGAFKKIVHKAGMEGYRLHDARHANATLMLKQGCTSQNRTGAVGPCKSGDYSGHIQPRNPRAPRSSSTSV